ncbi:NUDIX hydrolase [Marinococcus halophilus]|uniref:NUDIX hydrolase n=1 Tax=Marinococcus halophilus TaxID=1371 RepID=UPI0013035CD4|nr:NUDIX hydrolase [Marinococcus halophilus]
MTNKIPDTSGRKYIALDKPEAVVVLAKMGGFLLFIEQYRPPVESFVMQLPGGGAEPHEALADAARREFTEETGYTCGQVNYLGDMLPAPWRSNDRTHLFFTDDVQDWQEQQLEDHETIQVYLLPLSECVERVTNNTFTDGELNTAIFRSWLHGYLEL